MFQVVFFCLPFFNHFLKLCKQLSNPVTTSMCNQDLTVLFVKSQLPTWGGGKVKALFDMDVSTVSLSSPPTHAITLHQSLNNLLKSVFTCC